MASLLWCHVYHKSHIVTPKDIWEIDFDQQIRMPEQHVWERCQVQKKHGSIFESTSYTEAAWSRNASWSSSFSGLLKTQANRENLKTPTNIKNLKKPISMDHCPIGSSLGCFNARTVRGNKNTYKKPIHKDSRHTKRNDMYTKWH